MGVTPTWGIPLERLGTRKTLEHMTTLTDTAVSNVIPLFAPQRAGTTASTHFMHDHPACGGKLITLCGREGVGILDKDNAYPACEACIAAWHRMSGWSFPLPEVVCTD